MKTAISLTVLTVALASVAGCKSQNATDVSYSAIANNLTPELQTLSERPIDVDRHIAVMKNHNWRALQSDLGRVFYTDQPSRLAPYPVTLTSGQPR